MKGKISFTNLEKEYWPEMRNKINNSENKVDLGKHFSYTIVNLLEKAFEQEDIDLKTDDVIFNPDAKLYFTVSSTLLNQEKFKQTWEQSDLPNVVQRFADSTYHRYVHLNKHLEKTQKKIRN